MAVSEDVAVAAAAIAANASIETVIDMNKWYDDLVVYDICYSLWLFYWLHDFIFVMQFTVRFIIVFAVLFTCYSPYHS